MLESVWGRMVEYYQAERVNAPVKFPQRGDGDGYENENPGDPPDGEPSEKSRLCPDIGRPDNLKEIRLKGKAPVSIRRLRASQSVKPSFAKRSCALGRERSGKR